MATKKSTAKKSTMIKIAETIGTVAGEISVKKDQLTEMASHAIDSVKASIHNITAPKKVAAAKKTAKAAVKKALKPVAKKAAAVKKSANAAVKKSVKPALKKAAAIKKTAKKVVKKAVKQATKKAAPVKKSVKKATKK